VKRLVDASLGATIGYGALSFILIGAAILSQSVDDPRPAARHRRLRHRFR